MKLRRKRFSRTFVLNTISIGMAACAGVLAMGYMQSDVEPRWTRCIVDATPYKVSIGGGKKWASKRLFCENQTVVIALKKDQELPLTKDDVLQHDTAVSCTYEVARNPFYLFRDQVVTDTVECTANQSNDTG